MKKIVLLFCVLFLARSLHAENLIQNGNFEKDNPEGWETGKRLVTGTIMIDRKEKAEGKNSLCIFVTGKNTEKDSRQNLSVVSNKIDVVPGMELIFSVMLKAEDILPGNYSWAKGRFTVNYCDTQGKRIAWSDPVLLSGTSGWKKYSGTLTVPQGAVSASFRFGLTDSTGKLWIDDFSVRRQSGPATGNDTIPGCLPNSKNLLIPATKRSKFTGKNIIPENPVPVTGGKDNPAVAAEVARHFPDAKWSDLKQEGYFLFISRKGIFIGAETEAGVRNANRTLAMIRKESGTCPECAIMDYPSISRRGIVVGLQWFNKLPELLLRADKLKFNFIWHHGSFMDNKFSRNWREQFTPGELKKIRQNKTLCDQYGIDVYMTFTPRGTPPVEYSSEKEIDLLVAKMKELYAAGIRNLGISFDDLCNIEQDRLIHPDDITRFHGNIGEAHRYFVGEVFRKLKKSCPDVEFSVLPMFYQGFSTATPQNLEYVRTLAKIPADIRNWCACLYTLPDAGENIKLTGRKTFIWDNGFTSGKQALFPPGLKRPRVSDENISAYMFLPANPAMEDASGISWLNAADYMWSAENYDPEESRTRAIAYIARDSSVREILTGYSQVEKRVHMQDFPTDKKEKRLIAIRDTANQLESYRSKAKGIPSKFGKAIITEIENEMDTIRFLEDSLKNRDYPVMIPEKYPEVPQASGFFPLNCKESQSTRAFLRYDRENLYLRIECAEPHPEKLSAKRMNRDSSVFLDDSVEIFIMPPATDNVSDQVYYHFAINSKGGFYDSKHIRRRYNYLHEKRDDWNSSIRITPKTDRNSWSLDLAIPWSDLGIVPRKGERFFMNIARDRQTTGKTEYTSFSPIPKSENFHSINSFLLFSLE